ncbi:MAG: pyruvate ferredoxin oxidoreductase subunit gamma [Candidatus Micrarchaeia archaeon]|jgi:pyruvate ferredoxin oxidoreductase gamma subunit
MIEIRFHGRGGQGAVTAAEILATAAFLDGKEAQAFPNFGVERTGAPVQAYCRIDEKKIRLHQQVYNPDYVVVLDDTLVESAKVFDGLKPGGMAVIATKKHPKEFPVSADSVKVRTVDAYAIAKEKIGRPIVNTAVLGALSRATGMVTLDSLKKAVAERFPPAIAEKNVAALQACYDSLEQ